MKCTWQHKQITNKLMYAAEIKLTKPRQQKPHWVILRSPLPRIHYYQNKQLQVKESEYLIPIYSWTLTPIHNWTCYVVTISPFNARLPIRDKPIAWIPIRNFNHQLEKVIGYNILQFITRWRSRSSLVTKPYSA